MYVTAGQDDPDLVRWIMASSSFPIFFPMEVINDKYYSGHFTDGGVVNIAPLKDAIDLGANEIDVILASPTKDEIVKEIPGILGQIMRVLELMSTEILINDLKVCNEINANLSNVFSGKRQIKIRVFEPKKILTDNSLDFNPEKIKQMYQIGKFSVT